MSKVHAALQEFQHRRDGLIKGLTANLDTIVEEAKRIGKETPYDQRKCLWGLEDKSWELRHAEYPCSEAPPQPEPLPPFEEGMSLIEWITIVADFSYAWLATFSAYLSSSFTLEERKELLKEIRTLPLMRDVVVLKYKCTC
ncbi:PHD finger protein ALFIN-LIKE 3-like [Lolium rigidum]|uniref:PHD finger protein ALFIN-LIKE 3-like n=1 Tax=Lolium rigidum TaxID=89674 RepID=UPI001F5D2271|nr:PHD finger protein ALFIN-LIKE 3-like [Lolium rigidum]